MILGITGGICSGKSTAADVIARLGYRVIDADEISRFITSYHPQVLSEIHQAFGREAFYLGGALNRGALAALVFADEARRKDLEKILHPPILELTQVNIDAARLNGQHLVVVAPLMIEAGAHQSVDRLWVIACSNEQQVRRLVQRTGDTAEAAQRWIDAQMPLDEKKSYADTVLSNDGTIEEFKALVAREWNTLVETD
ncbi:dephospho-CoA kinase [bacterium]|nr:dephospho-CoA kinase [bacterium]